MTDVRDATDALLADRPDLEDDLRTVLDVDTEQETWAFDDVPLDSGSFGELVSRGIVEKIDGDYRLANREAVRAALEGEEYEEASSSGSISVEFPVFTFDDIDRVLIGSVVALLALTVLMRTVFSWESVFRGEYIVLTGNDPYFYRYWLEELLRIDPSLGGMPQPLLNHDVLMIAVTWGFASLLGGTARAVGLVLAWYPVVTGVLVGLMVYATAAVAFDDRRVGLASFAIYAVTPVAAYRSSLGFGDHHAFDYIWVGLAMLSLVLLANERSNWQTVTFRRVGGFVGLAVALAAQVHAWRGGPLLILPVAAYFVVRVASDVQADQSPLAANAWTFGGLTLGMFLALVPHITLGWSGFYRAFAPALLFVGAVVVAGVAEGVQRTGYSGKVALGVEVAGGLFTAVVVWFSLPAVRSALQEGLRYFGIYGETSIAETYSLLSPALGGFFAPVLFFGLAFFFGLGALVWVLWRLTDAYRPGWLVVAVYTLVLLVGALIQLRFAGQLAIPLAVFSGLAFVYLAAVTNMTDQPRPFVVVNEGTSEARRRFRGNDEERRSLSLPSRQGLLSLGILFLLVGGMGFVQTPVKTNQLTIDDATFDTSLAVNQHAAKENLTWPQNYVFSEWGRNRVYNYFVNGHSRSYSYSRGNYEKFVTSSEPKKWYQKLKSKPTGYVVMQPISANVTPTSMQTRLWKQWGSASEASAGVGHYQAVYANDGRKVFKLVEGAMIVGQGTPDETVFVRTQFKAAGQTHTYERRPRVTANGWYAVRVPYAGTYEVNGETKQVPESAVERGQFVIETGPNAQWPLNASRGDVVFDIVGGHHGYVHGATWVNTSSEIALSFDGNDSVVVNNAEGLSGDRNFSLSVTFRTRNGTDYVNDVKFPRLAGTAPAATFRNSSGYQLALARGEILATVGNSESATLLNGPRVDDGTWHTATLVRSGNMVQLYLDGKLVDETTYRGKIAASDTFAIGATSDGYGGYVGTVKNVTYDSA